MTKKLIAFLLAALLCAALVPAVALADDQPEAPAPESPAYDFTAYFFNPLYRGALTESDLIPLPPPLDGAPGVTCATPAEAGAYIRSQMRAREEVITFGYTGAMESEDTFSEMLSLAFAHTGVPTEGDYLRWQYGGMEMGYAYDGRAATITCTVAYYTDAAQEAAMDAAVASALASLDFGGGTDYEKVRAIYDFICDNVTYDYANLDNGAYTLKYTAYAALINHTSVCQGYAELLYRMLLEVGVDCRLIGGYAGGEHAWNIVRLGGLYYTVDSTWDAGRAPDYDYFLKSDFSDHTRDPEYDTAAFHAAYPMSPTDYDPTAETPAPDHTPGDINGDGKINVADVVRLAQYIKARGAGVDTVEAARDVNGDGKVNVADVVRLAQYIKARGVGVEIR